MKTLLTFLVVSLLNGAFLYPLFYAGIGKPVMWWLVAAMAAGGLFCFYLLVKHRKNF